MGYHARLWSIYWLSGVLANVLLVLFWVLLLKPYWFGDSLLFKIDAVLLVLLETVSSEWLCAIDAVQLYFVAG